MLIELLLGGMLIPLAQGAILLQENFNGATYQPLKSLSGTAINTKRDLTTTPMHVVTALCQSSQKALFCEDHSIRSRPPVAQRHDWP